ncbi:MAG: ferrous iron transporter B [Chromatiaceae bacterium]|nr:ferrous iron transporter B [Chromatiaceae bacterium]
MAIVGRNGSGKHSIFHAAASTRTRHERLAGIGPAYEECLVEVGVDQISLVALPAIEGFHAPDEDERVTLKYLLWGDRWPAIAQHEDHLPATVFAAPDVLLMVMDATALERDLELALELMPLGRPMVFALNRMDEARARRRFINVRSLAAKLGGPVVPTVAHMGIGLAELFTTLTRVARETRKAPPVLWAHPPSPHIVAQWGAVAGIAREPEVAAAFAVPEALLTLQLVENEDYFAQELQAHFPDAYSRLLAARAQADAALPRPLAEEIHADRHHRAAVLFEAVTRPGQEDETPAWQRWADDLFLHPQWGFVGTLVIFAMVLFFVFEVSAFLDGLTVARLIAWAEPWQPTNLLGVLARAVLDGVIGLAGIVIPYMIPLVMLLVVLEESGIMHRVAFVVDRGFHQLGLHGGVALPFLMGLGCNVPALAATAAVTRGRDRTVASLLITFLPCSARSAILLAVGGKYLGGFGVFALFMLIPVVVSLVGKLLQRRYPETTPGIIQEIPAYALPTPRQVVASTWDRSRDIVTIVLPLLVAGSVVLALLDRYGADAWINLTLTPITSWWLGLPVALGVPILFGVLRKELSLLMVFQALGTQELSSVLDTTQIVTFLVFLTFYVPCVSTFAMMLKLLGPRDAYYSVALSIGVALVVAVAVRWPLELVGWLV